MTLIDTTMWINFLRRNGAQTHKVAVGDLLAYDAAAYTCPVRYELIQGARTNELPDLLTALNLAERIPMQIEHWDTSADIAARLRGNGVTIPPTDIMIASVAVAHGLPLLTNDTHFLTLQQTELPGLRLLTAN